MNAWNSDNSPMGGSTYGTLDTYFRKIKELGEEEYDAFFVTAKEVGGDHFIQVSCGADPKGARFYEFDIPITGWSQAYTERIESEARQRGQRPVRSDGTPMAFLDVSFREADAHDAFARWVVEEVFRLSDGTQFEITWG